MNTFGLGLILNFTDNATSGLREATGAFNELSNSVDAFSSANSAETALLQISAAAGIVGNELSRVGSGITSLFTDVISSVTETGTNIASARAQLSTLYGDMQSGQNVLDQIKDYAAKSIFNFEDLIPSVIMLKANGIEAFDQIATSAYRATNGVEGVSQTLMDYAADLAAFNPQMHNMYGTGVQAAMGALNEYIAEGNAASLKRGASLDILQILGEEKGKTIEERSRQVADLIEQLGMVGMTANLAGTASQRLSNVEDVLFNLMTQISDSGVFEKYTELVAKFTDYIFAIPDEEMAQIAQIISDALVELMEPLEYVLDLIIQAVDWIRELVRENPEITKMIIKGVALAGIFMVIAGAALKLLSALGMLRFSIGLLFKNSVLSSGAGILSLFKNLALYVLPIISAVILLKEAWDRNFMGMQERLKSFVTEVIDTFKILFDAWGDNSLSEDNFARARELGILPLIEAILQLKYHLEFLVEGFKNGFNAFFDTLGKILTRMGFLDEETHGFRDLITKLLEKITAPGLTDNWEKLGYFMGQIAGWAALALTLLPLIVKAISAVLGIIKLIVNVAKSLGKIVGIIKTITAFISDLIFYVQYATWFILDAIGSVVIAILSAVGIVVTLPAWVVGLIVAAIVAIIALIWHFRDEIAAFLVESWLKVYNFFKQIITTVKSAIKIIWDWFSNTKIGESIINKAQIVGKFISNTIDLIHQVIRLAVYSIIWLFQSAVEVIKNLFSDIANFFREVWDYVANEVVTPFVDFLQRAFEWVKTNIFEPVGEVFSRVFDSIADKIHWLKDNVVEPVFTGIKDFITNAIQAVSDFVMPILDKISSAISFVTDGVSSAIDIAGDVIGGAADWVKEKADSVQEMVGLSTGGYVKTTGIAVLHPNEVVVNDTLTKNLSGFLSDYDRAKDITSPLIVQDIIATDDYREQDSTPTILPVNIPDDETPSKGDTYNYVTNNATTNETGSPMQTLVNNSSTTNNNATTNNESGDTEIDNSVIFESGSIIFNIPEGTDISHMTEAELNAFAEKLMRIIARKMQLRNMQTRK